MWLEEKDSSNLRHIVPADEDYTHRHPVPMPWFEYTEKVGDKDGKEN